MNFLYVFILLFSWSQISSENIFSTNTTIAHPESGLFLDYVGPYTPSETIIHNSAIFPMTNRTCHFLPLSAVERISSCNWILQRTKRLISGIITLGIGAATLGLSASNSIQISGVQKEVALVSKSLAELSQVTRVFGVQLVKIQSEHIQLAEQLQMTQKLLESAVPTINNHSEAINALESRVSFLQMQFQHSFLYQAITQIFRNDLTLAFLAPQDLHTVVYSVIRQGNLTFNPHFGSLPLAHIVTRLLVRQQLDFIPNTYYETSDPSEIGRLVITSYFAVPRSDQSPFLIYKLITTPFIHDNETVQLAQIPQYLAIDPSNNVTIEWYDQDNSKCDFQLMTTCRDTPPFRSMSNSTCVGQILGGSILSKCLTVSVLPSPFFLRQLRDNLWVTSSAQSLHCVVIPKTEFSMPSFQTSSLNEQLILPPVALVNVTSGSTIACPGFSLMGRPIEQSSPSVVILYNNTLFLNNISVVDVHRHITGNSTWSKRKLMGRELKEIMRFIEQPPFNPTATLSHPMYMFSLYMIFPLHNSNHLQYLKPVNMQNFDFTITAIWSVLKTLHEARFSSLPSIDTTLLSIRDWLREHFSSHSNVDTALKAINILDSTPSSAFLRRHNVDPDDVLRLTWFLVGSRASVHQLFFEVLLEINENTSFSIQTTRFLQLAWMLSPIFTSHVSELKLSSIAPGESKSTGTYLLSDQPQSSKKQLPTPLTSLHLDTDRFSPNCNTHPIPLMSFYAPPPSLSGHHQPRKPKSTRTKQQPTTASQTRLHSEVCRQSAKNTVIPHQESNHNHQQTKQQQPDSVSIPHSPLSDLKASFDTEMIELC
ncbi:unnamed protein product [Rotaria sp. Silwood2]|nr:unnamed protein product [Rotaria sp. Silwood2]